MYIKSIRAFVYFVNIRSPVFQISYTSKLVEFPQQINIHVGDENHFCIWSRLCLDPIGGVFMVVGDSSAKYDSL